MKRNIGIGHICKELNLKFTGPDVDIETLALCNRTIQHKSALSYVTNDKYEKVVFDNNAIKCLVVSTENMIVYDKLFENLNRSMTYIISSNPETTFYYIHDFLIDKTDFYSNSHEPAQIGLNCRIADTAIIKAGAVIGNNVEIGENSIIKSNTIIEDNVIIGCNSVIGAEGFQVIQSDGKNSKIRHCGGTLVCEDAFIGDNSTICNTLFEGYTYIGRNAMIDNLVHVGHNGYVGDGAVVTAGVILCGSAIIEAGAWIGVNSSVLNRVVIGENSKIGIASVVTRDIAPGMVAYGSPAKTTRTI